MLFFQKKSYLLTLAFDDDAIRAALLRLQSNGKSEVRQYEEEVLPEGTVKMGSIENMDAASVALRKLMERIKGYSQKVPVAISIPAPLFYSAYIDELNEPPKGRPELMDLTAKWLPFRFEDLAVRNEWHPAEGTRTSYLYLAAVETNTLQRYRLVASRANLSVPFCIPITHGLSCMAFGEAGPMLPSLLLDMTSALPVLSLCHEKALIDERVLFGPDPSLPFVETIQAWSARLSGNYRPKKISVEKIAPPANAEEKKKDDGEDTGKKRGMSFFRKKEDRPKTVETKTETPGIPTMPGTTAVPVVEVSGNMTVTIVGDQERGMGLFSKLKNAQTTVQNLKTEQPALIRLQALGCGFANKSIPQFT